MKYTIKIAKNPSYGDSFLLAMVTIPLIALFSAFMIVLAFVFIVSAPVLAILGLFGFLNLKSEGR